MMRVLVAVLAIALTRPAARQAPSTQAQAPPDPFARLLWRLDNAPAGFDMLEPRARRGSEMQASASAFSLAMQRVTPALGAIARSKALGLLGRVPIIGTPARLAQESAASGVAISHGFDRLVEADRRYIEPLRQAEIACARLHRSRSQQDVRAAVVALDAASVPLRAYAGFAERQAGALRRLADLLDRLDRLAPAPAAPGARRDGPRALAGAAIRLRELAHVVELHERRIAILRDFVLSCTADGHATLSDRGGVGNGVME